jgi:hypothetical protein
MLDARTDLTVRHGLLEPTGVTKGTANAGFLGLARTSPATVVLLRYPKLAEVRNLRDVAGRRFERSVGAAVSRSSRIVHPASAKTR